MAVYVLDRRGTPLMPCSEKRARKLLEAGRARVHRLRPFVIRLVDRVIEESKLQPLRVKIDPGSKTSGLALVRESQEIDTATGEVTTTAHALSLMELIHRGWLISKKLEARRAMRRRRRSQLRHRAPRFNNRTRREGWLPPSLQHRMDTVMAWVKRLQRWTPIIALSCERVRFDMQQMQNPEINGIEYQQGTLYGYEVREYLLEKWHRQCAYCDIANVPLQIDHITPCSKGGSDRVSNLTVACAQCNGKLKGAKDVRDFLAHDPQRLASILAHAKAPLRDAAAVNATRNALANALTETGLSVEFASGGQTKYNRTRLGLEKTHAFDALCVGNVHEVTDYLRPTLQITCNGRGSYQRTRLNRFGFPRGYLMRQKHVHGFQTGDLVRANVPSGKKIGVHVGRVAVRKTGSFNIQTRADAVQGISHRYCTLLQRADGYGYQQIA